MLVDLLENQGLLGSVDDAQSNQTTLQELQFPLVSLRTKPKKIEEHSELRRLHIVVSVTFLESIINPDASSCI